MIVQRSMSESWLSNSWLVADRAGGCGVLVDAGGPPEPILEVVRRQRLRITHLLVTHHHTDHVAHLDAYRGRFTCPVLGHPLERAAGAAIDRQIEDGHEFVTGDLRVRALHTPGHTRGMLAFVVNEQVVFTGDTLFRETVGGTMAPEHGTYAELHRSIMQVLMALPPATRVLPGHTEETTIGHEWENNPFVRIWRGLDAPGNTPVRAFGRPATLVLRARDYDGGTKCWVRFGDRDEIVPGSRVVGD